MSVKETAQKEPQASTRKSVDIGSILIEGRAFIALIVLVIAFTLMSDTFLTMSNLTSMTKHVSINAIMAIGMLFVILKAGIDLSIGSTLGLSGVVAGVFLQGMKIESLDRVVYPPVWVVILISLSVGTFVGFVNGWLITRFEVAPFVATLGMAYVARGAALLISDGQTFPSLQGTEKLGNTGFDMLGSSELWEVPSQIWIMIVIIVIAVFVLAKTPFGRSVFAVGGNERAAELAGVPVKKVKVRAYMIAGCLAALGGLIMASQLTSALPNAGKDYELNAIAACVIGGASLMGGRGNIRGVVIGAFVIGFLNDGLVNLNVTTFWQTAIKGAVIILAVILDQTQQKIKGTRNAELAAKQSSDD